MKRWLLWQVGYVYLGTRSHVDSGGWLCYTPTGRVYLTRLRIPVTRRFANRVVAWVRRAAGDAA